MTEPKPTYTAEQPPEADRTVRNCPYCLQRHGYTYRISHVVRLRITVLGGEIEFAGDGWYTCPQCGARVEWSATAEALSRLLAARTRMWAKRED